MAAPEVSGTHIFPLHHHFRFVRALEPQRRCASQIECGSLNVVVYAPCIAENGRFFAHPEVHTYGTVYVYTGPLTSLKVRPVADRAVRNEATIRRHVNEWHVNPAVDAVEPQLIELNARDFATLADCRAAVRHVQDTAVATFADALRETESAELRGLQPTSNRILLARFDDDSTQSQIAQSEYEPVPLSH